jgi:poly(beta-D-mannuronate) lyase
MIRLPALALALMLAHPALAADCPPAPEPVLSLDYASRYAADSESRSDIDAEAKEKAEDALRPIDDFLRDLTAAANAVMEDGADRQAAADCVVAQIATWAGAGAMRDLQSETARLTAGSRIAGFGLVLLQVMPHSGLAAEAATIRAWLADLMQAQMLFWEEEAPRGAKQGNLRAWAALGGSTAAALLDDPVIRGWSAWSLRYILCKAEADGSLPQEMRRERLALQYQLHSIAPLVVSTLLLSRQGIDLRAECDGALRRVVDFAVADVADGAQTRAITGVEQSFFDGSDTLEGFHLAWLEAWLILAPEDAAARTLAEAWRPLSYSKLGGNQTQLWQAP